MLTYTTTLSVVSQLQASSTNSTRLLSIGIPSCSRLLRRQHLVRSTSPQEHALSKSLICALHFDTSEYLSTGQQWSVLGDNESVINSAAIPHSKMHKRWVALSYHRVQHAVAAGITNVHHIAGKKNPAGVLSKHWDLPSVWNAMKPPLFWNWKLMAPSAEEVKEGSNVRITV